MIQLLAKNLGIFVYIWIMGDILKQGRNPEALNRTDIFDYKKFKVYSKAKDTIPHTVKKSENKQQTEEMKENFDTPSIHFINEK